MERTIIFKDYMVRIIEERFNNYPSDYNFELSINLTRKDGAYCFLLLCPLWNIQDEAVKGSDNRYKLKFLSGDFFQDTIHAEPEDEGLGSAMHDFLIKHFRELQIRNVYSTNSKEDERTFSIAAEKFWQSRVRRKIGLYDKELERYRLILPG